jgi:hypothetical protein
MANLIKKRKNSFMIFIRKLIHRQKVEDLFKMIKKVQNHSILKAEK